ncbi:hypothetical protein SEA_LONELYSOIL_66 [Microbacterium phage Lonelysoil]|nr:hypothetical protein SEA_BLAB_66 [Microbacterium phage Blab]WNM75177.1 hypothetical protein SEA_LONELYSOIL_66 [Microbacterium phage Lonelysoil]
MTSAKKAAVALFALVATIALSGCNPTAEQAHQERRADIARQAELAEDCRDSGGRYLLTVPPGYTAASYWCIWDQEREGGEW